MSQSLISDTFKQAQPYAPTVSIIGSAGRRGDGQKMTKQLFSKMVDQARTVIRENFDLDLSKVHVVSGGAAWADHVAVVLYTLDEVSQLTLHLPAKWEDKKYHEKASSSQSSWKSPGQSANELHKKFSEKMGEDTLEHIDSAFLLGAKSFVYDGFQERNAAVARSQYLIAFTWGEGSEPKKGGTLDTWGKCVGEKIHIPLQRLQKGFLGKQTAQGSNLSSLLKKRDYSTCSANDDIECNGPKRVKTT